MDRLGGHRVKVERVCDHLVKMERAYDHPVTSLTLRAEFKINLTPSILHYFFFRLKLIY